MGAKKNPHVHTEYERVKKCALQKTKINKTAGKREDSLLQYRIDDIFRRRSNNKPRPNTAILDALFR